MKKILFSLFLLTTLFSDDQLSYYKIEKFEFVYSKKVEGVPEISTLKVNLSLQNGIWTAPVNKEKEVKVDLSDLHGHYLFSKEALDEIARALVSHLNSRGLSGIRIKINPEQIALDGKDLRKDHGITYVITPIAVSKIKTKAFGKHFNNHNRLDNYRHENIIKESPVKENQLLDRTKLNNYVNKLNRNSRRKVRAVIKEDENKDAFVLQYYIEEDKPWLIHGSVMNTGTRESKKLNEVFGIVNTQFSNHNDTVTFSYFTATFKDIWALYGSYEYPLPNDYSIKAVGILNDYNSANFGTYTVEYRSHEKSISTELRKLIWQNDDLFLDIGGALKLRNLKAHNFIADTEAKKSYFFPILSFLLNKVSATTILRGEASVSYYPNITDRISNTELEYFGRANVNQNWVIVDWNWYSSFYLGFLSNKALYNPHEGVIIFNGQYSFNFRLIPQFRQVLGGLFSVRGYPESLSPGDSSLNLILQYQYHFAMGFLNHRKVDKLPNWDFIPFVFLDYGQLFNNRKLSYEKNQSLLGTGIGAELRIKTYIIAKGNMGIALLKYRDPLFNTNDPTYRPYKVNPGDVRFNASLTCMY